MSVFVDGREEVVTGLLCTTGGQMVLDRGRGFYKRHGKEAEGKAGDKGVCEGSDCSRIRIVVLRLAHDGHGQVWGVVCRKCAVPEMFQERKSRNRRRRRVIYSRAARPAAWSAIVSCSYCVGRGRRSMGE